MVGGASGCGRRAWPWGLGFVVIVALAGCDGSAEDISSGGPGRGPGGPEADESVPFAARFDELGAYRLDGARVAYRRGLRLGVSKGDDADDERAAAPENHAITAPPADIGNVRPMVEWEPMRALVFSFPAKTAQYSQVSETFVNIAVHAMEYGEVWVLVDGSQAETIFKNKLTRAGVPSEALGGAIKFLRTRLDTHWLIDYGPLPIIDTALDSYAFADFRYYHDRPVDDGVPTLLGRNVTRLGEILPVTTYRLPLTTEGGTFQATSDGVCITGSRQIYNMSCLGGGCRDSILELSLADLQVHPYALEMESVLATYVGCKDLVVTHSITDDGTGHLDMYLKILDDSRLLVGDYRRPYDNAYQEENAALMDDNAAFLEAYVKADGASFQVVRMPMPGHRTVQDFFDTYEVPFTYLNSTFFNGLNLWPAYRFDEWTASRDEAETIWRQVLPDMEHVWLDAEELSYQSGAIHCVTRTVPRAKPHPWVDDGACSDGVCGGSEGGYVGACSIAGEADLCWGPTWLCGCSDCRECPEVVGGTPCGNIGWRGCCEEGDVLFCDDAKVRRVPCAGTGCGWDGAAGYYACGLVGEDPSTASPISCACEPVCDGRTCGDDGCGGTCGTCGAGALCVAGSCREDCVECTPGEMGCDGDVSWRCVEGADGCHSRAVTDCAASGRSCVEGDCVTVAEADPDPDLADGDRSDDASSDGDDGDLGPEPGDTARAEAEATSSRSGEEGCASGGALASTLMSLVVLVGRLAGRRRVVRACAHALRG